MVPKETDGPDESGKPDESDQTGQLCNALHDNEYDKPNQSDDQSDGLNM